MSHCHKATGRSTQTEVTLGGLSSESVCARGPSLLVCALLVSTFLYMVPSRVCLESGSTVL